MLPLASSPPDPALSKPRLEHKKKKNNNIAHTHTSHAPALAPALLLTCPPGASCCVGGVPISRSRQRRIRTSIMEPQQGASPRPVRGGAVLREKGKVVQLTSDKVLIQPIHLLHVGVFNGEASNLPVLDDPRPFHALGQWHVAVLQAPPNQQLCRRARVLFGKRNNSCILHPQRPSKWRVRLYCDLVISAEGSNVFARIERVHLYLIHSGKDPRL